jgi:hypothetical protein
MYPSVRGRILIAREEDNVVGIGGEASLFSAPLPPTSLCRRRAFRSLLRRIIEPTTALGRHMRVRERGGCVFLISDKRQISCT